MYGVKEVRQPNRPNQPDPDDVPGVNFSKGDPTSSLRSKILDNIRPSIVLEIRSIALEGSRYRGVLIIEVEESMDAPHEVLLPSTTRIPVRRADTTMAASLDEIERLIHRRDGLRSESSKTFDVQFFRERFGGPPNMYGEQRTPPAVGVAIRPRRTNSLGFAFDSRLDEKIREVALRNEIGDDLQPKPMPSGLVMEDLNLGVPNVRIEVHKNGTIHGARVLSSEKRNWIESSGAVEKTVEEKKLDFGEIASSVGAIVRFAAKIYALERPGTEMEVWFGLADCQGYKTAIPVQSPFRSYPGQIPDNSFYQQPVIQGAFVKSSWETGTPDEEDLLRLVREISRFFQISAPDERLRHYLE